MRISFLSVLSLFSLVSGSRLASIKRQTLRPDFTWALVGYELPGCKGELVANWRGSDPIPVCIKINGTRSISGGSGAGTSVNLWEDDSCKVPAGDLTAAGQDANGYPCFSVVVRSFTVEK